MRRQQSKQQALEDERWMAKVRCPGEHIVLFLRQMSIMLHTGVPIVVALETLSHQLDYPNFGNAVIEMSERVSQGHTFSNTMRKFPRLFSGVHRVMVRTGEQTGALADSLEQVAEWGERDNRLYRDVKSAFTYPLVVLVVAFLLTLVLFLTVVPGFVTMFEERDMELPLLTQLVVLVTNLISNPGVWITGLAVAALLFIAFRKYVSTESGALQVFLALTHIPVVGNLLVVAGTARYANVLGTLLNSGLDLVSSLRLAAKASGSPLFQSDAGRLMEEVQQGCSLAEGMAMRPQVYRQMLVEMVTVGEETSSLSKMFHQAAGFLDEEVSYRVQALSAALEPLMLIFVSVLVGAILLAIIMPLYGFLNQLA